MNKPGIGNIVSASIFGEDEVQLAQFEVGFILPMEQARPIVNELMFHELTVAFVEGKIILSRSENPVGPLPITHRRK